MTFTLRLRHGRPADAAASTFALAGTDVVVGSAPDCDWRLAGPGVAPRHAQFGFRGGAWHVVDLGGGTHVNGRPLDRPAPVAAGDEFRIGDCTLVATPATGADPVASLLAAAGIDRAGVAADDAAILAAAGTLLRDLVAGVAAELAARAGAKAQLGAAATLFAPGPANPLRTLPPGRALAALLAGGPATMAPAAAAADAFADLESHRAAMLGAMQGALAATLERFSPAAIRERAAGRGVLARVLPHARDAALWGAYEREFDGAARGSSDAFVDLVSAEFARAYTAISSAARPRS